MSIVCVIPARSGSKGIINKNIIDFNGKPLIAWTIEAAVVSKQFSRVIVSTNNIKIAKIAKKFGAEVPFSRPKTLANDNVHASKVVMHTLMWLKKNENYIPKAIAMLLPTSPLREVKHIKSIINIFKKKNVSSVISVEALSKYPNNLRYLVNGKLIKIDNEKNIHHQRQNQKKLYAVNGSIFLANTKKFIKKKTFHLPGALGYEMNVLNSVDINEKKDLDLANSYFKLIRYI
ncbi:acylneuraminate cytidylyltransferase family protein [Candidatus Pelagibacter bacterium]|nr:acylneuraminate cytidylyltransferase family protein [Candidatus Pelagibacter bacterium]